MTTSRDDRPMGLRERKKARTRARIQDHALRLFIEQGYAGTTVEQIAEAAEVSQSTFFRYFPTKEETVLYDRLDPVLIENFLAQPADLTPIAAMRAAISEVFGSLDNTQSELEQARQQLIFSAPELRTRVMDQLTGGLDLLNDAIAQRVGRRSDDLDVRIFSGAVVGVVVSTYLTSAEVGGSYLDFLDRGLASLETGLPF